ncbi:MAG: hypothetical protein JXA37_09805 [Chloroflexia bacterium]|nr:hypothetical protein [Chloroflexia bacterium]
MIEPLRRDWNDLSPQELGLAHRLQGYFDLEQEQLPPLYLETLNPQRCQEASPSAGVLEERIIQRVFDRLGLERQPRRRPEREPARFLVSSLVFAAGALTLLLLLGCFLYYPPLRQATPGMLGEILRPPAQPPAVSWEDPLPLRSFASIWEAQPYVDFPLVHLHSRPAGFRLEEVQVRGSSAAVLLYRHWNAEFGRWERLILIEYRDGQTKNTPFPIPQVVGPEQEVAVQGLDITLIQHEGTPDAEGTAQAQWESGGIRFHLYGPLSVQEVKALAGDVLRAIGD